MKDKTKELYLKFLIVMSAITFSLIFILIFSSCFLNEIYNTVLTRLIHVNMALFAIFTLTLMISMPFIKIKLKPQKSERYISPFETYNDLVDYFQQKLQEKSYQKQEKIIADNQIEMHIFIKKKLWAMECYCIVRLSELTEETLDIIHEKFSVFIEGYYGTDYITDQISLTSLICVDRITPTFQKYVNSNIEQGFKLFKLPVGISFGGKRIYIAKQKDGFAITRYKKLRKQFLRILTSSYEMKRLD